LAQDRFLNQPPSFAIMEGLLRCRQCLQRRRHAGSDIDVLHGSSSSSSTGRAVQETEGVPTEESVPEDEGRACQEEVPAGLAYLPFRVAVTSYQRGDPVIFKLTVRRGDAVWQIRRRYRQFWAVHQSLLLGLGGESAGLPRPPPRKTVRSTLYGPHDARFLETRAIQLETYLRALLDFIPCAEQCEALYNFLCLVNQHRSDLDLLHGEIVGGGAPPVDAAAIAKLPRKSRELPPLREEGAEAAEAAPAARKPTICVICQEPNDPSGDIRELPCGHEFHFKCIDQWLRRRNTCCVCNGPGVLSAPRMY